MGWGELWRVRKNFENMEGFKEGKEAFFSYVRDFLPGREAGEGRKTVLHRERVSAAQPLAETGKGYVGGKR